MRHIYQNSGHFGDVEMQGCVIVNVWAPKDNPRTYLTFDVRICCIYIFAVHGPTGLIRLSFNTYQIMFIVAVIIR